MNESYMNRYDKDLQLLKDQVEKLHSIAPITQVHDNIQLEDIQQNTSLYSILMRDKQKTMKYFSFSIIPVILLILLLVYKPGFILYSTKDVGWAFE